jgi:predicted nucleic acid-binding protein
MKLLDTTFLIHYWGGRDEVKAYLEAHENEEFITTSLNIKEVAVGRDLQGALDHAEIRSTFEWVRIVPFGVEHSFVAGELEAALHGDETVNRDKINALAGDILIGAVAKEQNATVVTRNTSDFERLSGVSTESYMKPE